MRVSVREGQINSAQFVDDATNVPGSMLKDLFTVNAVFDAILSAQSQTVESIRIEFDAHQHYPKEVQIDFDKRIADDEIHWLLSDLELHAN